MSFFNSPPAPKKKSWERCWWPYIRCTSPPAELIKNHSKGKACSLCAPLTLACPLSLMLTLLSLISAECHSCNLLGQTTSDREPCTLCRPWPRASQHGSSSAAVAVSLFFSPALCLQKGQDWLLLPIMPAGLGRSTSSSPTSGIAPTPWLKWYSNPRVLHGGIWGPPSLPVPWLPAFGIPLSFSCLSPEKNHAFALRQSLGRWSGPVACWLCSQGKLLPLPLPLPKDKAALGTAQLLPLSGWLLLVCDNCETWA